MLHSLWVGRLVTLLFFAGVLIAWSIASYAGLVPHYLLPSPVDVWRAAADIVVSGYPFGITLQAHVLSTLRLAVSGFAIGSIAAVAIGLVVGWSARLRYSLDPIIAFFRGIPALAWIPLAIILFGINDASKLFIIVYGTFWIMLTHCIDAIARVDPTFVRVAQTFGASTRQILISIVLPAALPSIVTGLRVGYALAFAVVLSAEMVGAFRGLGFLIQDARDLVRTDVVLVGMITIGLVGYLTGKLLFSVERSLIRWLPVAKEVVVYAG